MKGESGLIVPSRMSMAYLFKAERSMSVGPLPKFVSSTEPAKYPDITALEFQRWKNSIVYSLDNKEQREHLSGFHEKKHWHGVDGLLGMPTAADMPKPIQVVV